MAAVATGVASGIAMSYGYDLRDIVTEMDGVQTLEVRVSYDEHTPTCMFGPEPVEVPTNVLGIADRIYERIHDMMANTQRGSFCIFGVYIKIDRTNPRPIYVKVRGGLISKRRTKKEKSELSESNGQ